MPRCSQTGPMLWRRQPLVWPTGRTRRRRRLCGRRRPIHARSRRRRLQSQWCRRRWPRIRRRSRPPRRRRPSASRSARIGHPAAADLPVRGRHSSAQSQRRAPHTAPGGQSPGRPSPRQLWHNMRTQKHASEGRRAAMRTGCHAHTHARCLSLNPSDPTKNQGALILVNSSCT